MTRSNVVQLNKEREDAQAIDYLKVLTPGLIGGVTQAGIAAIVNETSRDRIAANRDVRIAEVGVDSEIIGAINNAIDELDDNELTPETADVTADDVAADDATDLADDVLDLDGDTVVDDTPDTTPDADCDVTFSPTPPECS